MDALKFVPALTFIALVNGASILMINVTYYFERYSLLSRIALATSVLHANFDIGNLGSHHRRQYFHLCSRDIDRADCRPTDQERD